MGFWDESNLGNDGAQDELSDICDALFEEIIDELKQPVEIYEASTLFVRIEMIFAMADRGMINSSPTRDELNPLISAWMEKWDASFKDESCGFTVERRRIMIDSFDKLLLIAESGSEGSFIHRLGLISDVLSSSDEENS